MLTASASKLLRFVVVGLATTVLVACGGGSGAAIPAPSGLSYSVPSAFVLNVPITPLTPTFKGTPTGFSIAPALPAGLKLDATTGVISGTPSKLTAKTSYTVTASNSAGEGTDTFSIVVNDLPPGISYGSSNYSLTNGVPAEVAAPKANGGAVTGWEVTPTLPVGLSLSATDGSIRGTPVSGSAATQYTITASNSGGVAVATLTISVSAAPLLELGHAASIRFVRLGTPNALSQDSTGHWVLWNFSNATMLASGNSPPVPASSPVTPSPVDMATGTLVIQTSTGLEIRASSNGAVLSEIAASFYWWKLALDGSYVCAGGKSGLTAWSPAGAVLFSKSGDYSRAVAFAAPGVTRVAQGAAGNTVIETVSIPSGTSSVSPSFNGTFAGWFTDGGRFLSVVGNTVLVFSSAAVQEGSVAVTSPQNVTGQGNWFWTFANDTGELTLYPVGFGSQPQGTYGGLETQAIPSGMTVALIVEGAGTMSVLDLSGSTPTDTSYPSPLPDLSAYASLSNAAFLVGDRNGVLIDGASLAATPRFLNYGAALSIAGGTNAVAIATGSGRILYFDPATNTLLGTINTLSSHLSMSSDGSVLAAANSAGDADLDRSVRIYSLPAATLINTFPFSANGTPTLTNMSLAASGTILGETLTANGTCDSEAVPVMGGAPVFCDDAGLRNIIELSPNGSLIATSSLVSASPNTNIYQNGSLVTAIPAQAVGWIDDMRLLVNNFVITESSPSGSYAGASIYGSSGTLQSAVNLPQLTSIQPVSPTTVYSPTTNAIYSLSSGAVTWTTASQATPVTESTAGAVSGSEVVFTSGNLVLAESY